MRRIMIIAALLGILANITVSAASAHGVSPDQLGQADWTCFVPAPGDNVHCAPPGGLARVLDSSAETMTFLVFQTSDPQAEEAPSLGTEFIVRADLFRGQPCPTDPPGRQYTYLLPLLGLNYYACHRYDSSF